MDNIWEVLVLAASVPAVCVPLHGWQRVLTRHLASYLNVSLWSEGLNSVLTHTPLWIIFK